MKKNLKIKDYLGKKIMAKHNNSRLAQVLLKEKRKVDAYGDAHISATFNNIIISLTNKSGQIISWSSAGRDWQVLKETPPAAAQMAAADAAKTAFEAGFKRVDVYVKGPGAGRESSIRSISKWYWSSDD